MLPVNCGSHTDYQHFVVTNLRKYYPDPDALALAGDGTPVVERSLKSSLKLVTFLSFYLFELYQ